MNKVLAVLLTSVIAVLSFAEEKTGPTFTPTGLAQYRLRGELTTNETSNGDQTKLRSYSNRIAYKAGLKAVLNPQVLMQFEIGNDWVSTDEVSGTNYNYLNKRRFTKDGTYLYPTFTLAYVQWDPGYMHILAGIIPVKGSYLLDLYAHSIYNNKKYRASKTSTMAAGNTPWAVITNGSMQALKLGAPLVKGDWNVGIDLLTSVQFQDTVKATKDVSITNDAIAFLLDIPVAYKGLSAKPQFLFIANRNFKRAVNGENERDNEIGLGIDFGYKVNDKISLRTGYGFEFVTNIKTKAATAKDTVQLGQNMGLGVSAKFGPGKFDFDFNYSNDQNTKLDDSISHFPFFDTKYAFILNKNFSITPRLRLFMAFNADESSIVLTRPELIFNGSF
jgi:hypothetical protein